MAAQQTLTHLLVLTDDFTQPCFFVPELISYEDRSLFLPPPPLFFLSCQLLFTVSLCLVPLPIHPHSPFPA